MVRVLGNVSTLHKKNKIILMQGNLCTTYETHKAILDQFSTNFCGALQADLANYPQQMIVDENMPDKSPVEDSDEVC